MKRRVKDSPLGRTYYTEEERAWFADTVMRTIRKVAKRLTKSAKKRRK